MAMDAAQAILTWLPLGEVANAKTIDPAYDNAGIVYGSMQDALAAVAKERIRRDQNGERPWIFVGDDILDPDAIFKLLSEKPPR